MSASPSFIYSFGNLGKTTANTARIARIEENPPNIARICSRMRIMRLVILATMLAFSLDIARLLADNAFGWFCESVFSAGAIWSAAQMLFQPCLLAGLHVGPFLFSPES
jgi:hypothetical protein